MFLLHISILFKVVLILVFQNGIIFIDLYTWVCLLIREKIVSILNYTIQIYACKKKNNPVNNLKF